MEAPLCKLCNERHYGMCKLPVAERPAVKAMNRIPLASELLGREPLKAGDTIKIVVSGNATEPDLKAGYNAYMREYMRKKRAKDKAK